MVDIDFAVKVRVLLQNYSAKWRQMQGFGSIAWLASPRFDPHQGGHLVDRRADPPNADDTHRGPVRAGTRLQAMDLPSRRVSAGAGVMLPGSPVQGQDHRKSMVGDFLRAVIGIVGKRDAGTRECRNIDLS